MTTRSREQLEAALAPAEKRLAALRLEKKGLHPQYHMGEMYALELKIQAEQSMVNTLLWVLNP